MRIFLFLRDCLQAVEQTKDRIVLRERPHYVAGLFFCAVGLVLAGLTLASPWKHHGTELGVTIGIGAYLVAIGLYGCTETTIEMDRAADVLRVKRRIARFVFEKRYPVNEISKTLEWETLKGNRLKLLLSTGKRRNLTLFAEYSDLGAQVGALNHLIAAARHRQGSPSPGSSS